MPYLLVGDLHLTDRPRDAYRFEIFDWIKEQQRKHTPKATFLMGDLTDQKDRHSAALVNRIVYELKELVNNSNPVSFSRKVFVIKGNHDYIDPAMPFFGFLDTLVTNPEIVMDGVAILPHCRDEAVFVAACKAFRVKKPQMLLIHNTMQGAIAETGAPLSGFNTIPIKQLNLRLGCFAGDVHKPQTAGPVVYVGAPFHVRFGDDFEPRCLLVHDDGKTTDLYFEAPRKYQLTARDASEIVKYGLAKDDQVKIIVELTREEVPEWKTHKQGVLDMCAKLGLVVFGVDLKVNEASQKAKTKAPRSRLPADVLRAFCTAEDAPNAVKKAGLELINDTSK